MNPFQPSFGKTPPAVIGRKKLIDDFTGSLDKGSGDERRATLFTRQRGMGKTVVLNQIAKRVGEKNWLVAEVTNNVTMLQDICDQILAGISKKPKRGVSGIKFSVMGFGAGLNMESGNQGQPGWRMKISKLLDDLGKKDMGVLFTKETEGYPYLIQLISSYIWRAHPDAKEITDQDVRIGIPQAQSKMFANIIESVLQELSGKDIAFLRAMSKDADVSPLSQIQKRLDVSQSYVSQYRRRLISAGAIYAPKRGYVKYAVPQMGKYFDREAQKP